jgi:ankyrin repeat protein
MPCRRASNMARTRQVLRNGGGPIFRAINSGNASEVLRLLNADPRLLNKADVAQQAVARLSKPGLPRIWATPLMYAARLGKLDMVKLLREAGAEINAGTGGRTALHWAGEFGHEEVVAYLLDQGARPGPRGANGPTPLMLACVRGHVRVALLLLDHMGGQGLEARGGYFTYTALYAAVRSGYERLVAQLLGHGARADTRDGKGVSALMLGAEGRSVGILRGLLQHIGGEGLDERDNAGYTAMHIAVHHDRPANVRALLLAGADPTIMDNQGRTPYVLADEEGEEEEAQASACAAIFRVSTHTQEPLSVSEGIWRNEAWGGCV